MSAQLDAAREEYRAARASWQAAEDRLQAAGRALRNAQCGEHYDTTPAPGGGLIRQLCTLAAGHYPATAHGKAPEDSR